MDLSIIIPAHNEELAITAQLSSLVGQSWHGEWEVIVVSNRSTDQTVQAALNYQGKGVNLSVVNADQQSGRSYARNYGARLAKGKSLAFLDADDVVAPGWVEAMGDCLLSHEFVGGAIHCGRLNQGWVAQTRSCPPSNQEWFDRPNTVIVTCNMGIRKELYWRIGGFDESMPPGVVCEDDDFTMRVLSTGTRPKFCEEAVLNYRYRSRLRHIYKQAFGYGRGEVYMYCKYGPDSWPGPCHEPLVVGIKMFLRSWSRASLGRLAWMMGWNAGIRYESILRKRGLGRI